MDNLEDLKRQISELQSKVAKIENESKEEKIGEDKLIKLFTYERN